MQWLGLDVGDYCKNFCIARFWLQMGDLESRSATLEYSSGAPHQCLQWLVILLVMCCCVLLSRGYRSAIVRWFCLRTKMQLNCDCCLTARVSVPDFHRLILHISRYFQKLHSTNTKCILKTWSFLLNKQSLWLTIWTSKLLQLQIICS